MAFIFPGLVFLCALVEWLAVYKHWRKVEYAAKPGVMALLLVWLIWTGGLAGPLMWFGLGLVFSAVGDVLLLLPNERRWFPWGLAAFLLAHLAYIASFNLPPAPLTTVMLAVALWIGLIALPLMRRILLGLRRKGLRRLVEPVRCYAGVLLVMLYSALVTLFRTDWSPSAAWLAALGATLFAASDLVLAWNKFVRPMRYGRLLLMILYHAGQILMLAGAVRQFRITAF